MTCYAHTLKDQPKEKWEPLFTPFGEGEKECQRHTCQKCEAMSPHHGHLNKVAYWTAQFAAEMLPTGPDRDAAHQWGYLTGLWHDLGKFAPEWQNYLTSIADPHTAEITGKIDHSTAGGIHATQRGMLGHLLAYPITGHHSGLLDAESNHACQKARWHPELAYLPVETVIRERQAAYYDALGAADRAAEATPFIEFILDAINEALDSRTTSDSPNDPVSDPVSRLVAVLKTGETLSIQTMMERMQLRHRTYFRRTFLTPALASSRLEMTMPDSPHHPTQRYRLTNHPPP